MSKKEFYDLIELQQIDLKKLGVNIGHLDERPNIVGCFMSGKDKWKMYFLDEHKNCRIVKDGTESLVFSYIYRYSLMAFGQIYLKEKETRKKLEEMSKNEKENIEEMQEEHEEPMSIKDLLEKVLAMDKSEEVPVVDK